MNWEVLTMQSATSFFNRALFRKNLQRFWPLWAGYTLIWMLILPMVEFSELLLDGYHGAVNAFATYETILDISIYGGIAMAAIFGIFFAMAEFSYLTNPRATQGVHQLPLRRETLYGTNYLSGLFCMCSSVTAAYLLTGLVTAAAGVLVPVSLLQGFAAALLACVFYYSFAVLCMIFTGQILAAPVFYGILNFIAVLVELLLRAFAGEFLFGYAADTGRLYTRFLSPTVLFADSVYVSQRTVETTLGKDIVDINVIGLDFNGFYYFVIYAAVGLVLAALGLLLYRRRASEETGSTVAIPWARPIFKYGVMFCAAISFGQLLYYMFFASYGSLAVKQIGATVCMILAGLLGYYAAEMLLKKRFKVFRSGAKGAIVSAAVLLLVGIGVSTDFTGYEHRVPAAQNIESAYINLSSNGLGFYYNVSEPETLEALVRAHAAIADDKALLADREWEDGNTHVSFYVSYALKNGSVLERRYYTYLERADLQDPTSAASQLTALMNTSECRRRLMLGNDLVGRDQVITGGYYDRYNANGEYRRGGDLTNEQARAVYDAMQLDFMRSGSGSISLFDDRSMHCGSVELWYNYKATPAEAEKYRFEVNNTASGEIGIEVTETMKNTLALLDSLPTAETAY